MDLIIQIECMNLIIMRRTTCMLEAGRRVGGSCVGGSWVGGSCVGGQRLRIGEVAGSRSEVAGRW